MISVASLIGILAGFGAVGISYLISYIKALAWGADVTLLEGIANTPWYWIILIPAIGGLIVGPITHYFSPESKGHGVPEVLQVLLTKNGVIRPRVALVKAITSAITIGTGGSVGREGPIIQIGASLGSTVGQILKVPVRRLKVLLGCGAGAGIAAAFNAPIAGALFAVEIILMDFAVASFFPIVIASVMATVVMHTFHGNFAEFQVLHYEIVSGYEIGFYFILGILCGLASYLFIKVLYYFEDVWENNIKMPEMLKPAVGGVLVGLIGIMVPQVLSDGYETIDMALKSNVLLLSALLFLFVKILATSLTLGSGGSGGVFAPALFTGAMVGAAFGVLLNMFFPDLTSQPGAYSLVAMGGILAGTMHAPITAILIVFELTKESSIILPLMIVCTTSMILSKKLQRESIFTLRLLQRNINIVKKPHLNVLERVCVEDILSKDYDFVKESDDYNEVIKKVLNAKYHVIAVLDSDYKYVGLISIHHIKDLLFEKENIGKVLLASDIVDKKAPAFHWHHTCQNVLEQTRNQVYEGFPVLDSDATDTLIGFIWRKDIGKIYQAEFEKIDLTSDIASKIAMSNITSEVHFTQGQLIAELPAPSKFVDKSIRELNIRKIYGVEVISIKQNTAHGHLIKTIPDPDYVIKANDVIIIAGNVEKVNILKEIL